MFRIAVVAHQARADQAHQLMDDVGAAYLSMSNGNWTCEQNHARCWQYHADRTAEHWAVVLEDDAQPVDGFRDQLEQALSVAPTPIVSLYLGQGRPPQWQSRVQQAIHQADLADASFITGKRLLHGVAICIRTNLIPSMLTHLHTSQRPIDWAIRDWAVTHGHDIAFTIPSLVDHADGPTLIEARTDSARTEQRTAWRVGTRERWTPKTVNL